MGFAQELKEFVAGFKTGHDMSLKATLTDAQSKYYGRDRRTAAQKQKDQDDAQWNAEAKRAGIDPASVPPVEEAADEGNITDAGGEGGEGSQISYEQLKKNLFGMESGGNYKAIGPTHPELGRALGIGQVMEANLPQWSKDALGRVVSADEFLNNPEIQDKIIDHRLGGYYRQYGPAGASSKWFTGSPTPKGRRDSLGTRDYDYVRRATRTAALPIEPEDQPIVFAASGGLIDDDYAGNDESGGSNPAVRDAVEKGYNPRDLIDNGPDLADMVADGVDGIQKDLSPPGQGVDTNANLRVEAFAKNIGAPSKKDVDQMKDTVDPGKKLPEALRPVAAWKGMYDYYTKQGRPAEAQRAAKAMLMYTRAVLTQGGYMAQAALEKGDTKGAANAIAGALNEAPDGKRMEVGAVTKNGVKFKIWDETTGEMTEEGEAKQDQILKMAAGLANGTEFMRGIGAIRPKTVDKVAARNEAERAAVEKFEGADEEGIQSEFLKSLPSDKARKEFLETPLRYQRQRRMEWFEKKRAERAEAGMTAAEEKEKWRRANKGGTGAGRGGTAAEREEARERAALQVDVPLAQYGASSPTEGVDAEGNPVASDYAIGTERADARRAAFGFNTTAGDMKEKPDLDEVEGAVDTYLAGSERTKGKEFNEQQKFTLTGLTGGILRGNRMSTKQAVDMATRAVDPNIPIKFVQDPNDPDARMVKLGNVPPIRLGPDELNVIAAARGGMLNRPAPKVPVVTAMGENARPTSKSGNVDQAGPALPGVTGNPRTVTERGAARGLRAPLNPVQEAQAAAEYARKRKNWERKAIDIDMDYTRDPMMLR
jgi:hypothetical protein